MNQSLRNFQQKDIELTSRKLSKTPFHTNFWVHRRIRESIAAHSHLAKGIMLDVGCGLKPYETVFEPYIEKYIGIEYKPDSGFLGNRADFCADAARLPLADKSVDTILCTEVLEHVPNPELVISEFARVLRENGVVICTAPFIYPLHDEFDFFRYTATGLAEIMKRQGLSVEKVESLSGSGLTLAVLLNMYIFDVGFMWKKWLYPVGVLLRPLLWIIIFLINMLGWLAEKALSSDHLAFDHLTIARRADKAETPALEKAQ